MRPVLGLENGRLQKGRCSPDEALNASVLGLIRVYEAGGILRDTGCSSRGGGVLGVCGGRGVSVPAFLSDLLSKLW